MTKQEIYLYKNHFITWLACKQHRTHKGEMLDFVNYPYLRQIYFDDESKSSMKSTQSGVSEELIVEAIGHALKGMSIFYVLPTIQLMGRFVQNRYYKSVEHSEFYKRISREGETKDASSMSLQHVGKGSIAFVGSNSPKVFTEYPADMVIIDELDQCNAENIEMAWERMSNSNYRREIKVSQPTVDGRGIHAVWLDSCQYKWYIKCDCGHEFHPDFFTHVLRKINESDYVIIDSEYDWQSGRDINLICDKCGRPVDRKKEGRWIERFKGKPSCYHISKLFSTKVSLLEIVERFTAGLHNAYKMQRVYNGDLGLPYTAKGSKLDDIDLDKCVGDFNLDRPSYPCVMGVDVGSMLHVRINELLPDGRIKAVYIGSVKDPEEVESLYNQYGVKIAVIDANPERRMAEKLCIKLKGMFRCFYGNELKSDNINSDKKAITVDRTSALDNVIERVLSQSLLLPRNASTISEYYDHMKASTRIYDPDINAGKGAYRWIESGADHFFHAEAYSLIAKNLLIMAGS